MATKHADQAIGQSRGFMAVLYRHLWLTLADPQGQGPEAAPKHSNCSSQPFGDAAELIVECITELQKQAKAMTQVMPWWTFQQLARSRFSGLTQEPDVQRKKWLGRKQRRSPRCNTGPSSVYLDGHRRWEQHIGSLEHVSNKDKHLYKKSSFLNRSIWHGSLRLRAVRLVLAVQHIKPLYQV